MPCQNRCCPAPARRRAAAAHWPRSGCLPPPALAASRKRTGCLQAGRGAAAAVWACGVRGALCLRCLVREVRRRLAWALLQRVTQKAGPWRPCMGAQLAGGGRTQTHACRSIRGESIRYLKLRVPDAVRRTQQRCLWEPLSGLPQTVAGGTRTQPTWVRRVQQPSGPSG